MRGKIISLIVAVLFPVLSFASGDSLINVEGKGYSLTLDAEAGFISVLSHSIQFGNSGTKFDYKEEGNQDIIFPFNRFSAGLRLFDTHEVVFLYQPLEVVTQAKAGRDIAVYDTVFTSGTVLDIKYGFSFYRASYVWYFLKDSKNELGAGISMQIRNASIIFKASDGTEIAIQDNIGPVPILKIKGRYGFENGVWFGLDADGFYASNAFFNGAEYPFEGAIWDACFRTGLELKNGINPYINIRMLGGGAKGTSQGEDAQGDGFTENWLNTISVTLGAEFK